MLLPTTTANRVVEPSPAVSPTAPRVASLARVRLLAMDVDGVLTDGTLGYGSDGAEQKRFHVHDGLGLTLLAARGIQIVWISGRVNPAVERRAQELGVGRLLQGVRDKQVALQELTQALGLAVEQVAYIGDDWNDLGAFAASGVRIAVANARREVRERADFVTAAAGGQGAVREVCDALLDASCGREQALTDYIEALHSGTSSSGKSSTHQ
jgi:3-deoxy-D-manno-octulosonate 8-phosphate phosphatase (KDO 8-P phosphatase)